MESRDIESEDTEDTFEQLRHLLIAPEQEKLDELGERLDNPQLHARDISQVLPMAISLSTQKDDRLTDALAPVLSKSVMVLIKKDVHAFANALFPVLGPAIRRSISETFKQMLQGLNQTLENSFSVNGIKWRFEAWRTGKEFSEIVLLHSLVYRVEQVFLIHRETGLLLLHTGVADGVFQDSDLVSGMLTAIQDFVRDSFDVSSDRNLDTIQMEDLTVWIERGPEAVIAAAIRGNAPQSVRKELQSALENIHLELGAELSNFQGDSSPFESARTHLDNCLQQRQEKIKKTSPLLWIIGIVLAFLLAMWVWTSVRDLKYWQNYLDQLNNEQGIVVTEVIQQGDTYHIYGLRDPLARQPSALLAKSMLDPGIVVHHFQPYQALTHEFILERAQNILAPPASVDISLNDGVMKLAGVAPPDWIQSTRGISRLIPGVSRVDDSNLTIKIDLSSLDAPQSVELTLDGTAVIAEGSAPHAWILSAREAATMIPGVTHYNDSEVIDTDYQLLNSANNMVEQEIILFEIDSSALDKDRDSSLVDNIGALISSADTLGKYAVVHVIGHSDSSGFERHNMLLSQDRANSVFNYLIANGISQQHLVSLGVGSNQPVTQETSEDKLRLNRSVTFKVELRER